MSALGLPSDARKRTHTALFGAVRCLFNSVLAGRLVRSFEAIFVLVIRYCGVVRAWGVRKEKKPRYVGTGAHVRRERG